MMIKKLCAFSLLFVSTFTQAQDSNRVQKKELGEALVKATRSSDKAPFSKTNLSASDLQTYNNGVDLPILLSTQTSVITNSDAGNGVGYTGLRIRGTDVSRINVTINGVPVNDAEGQGVFFVNTPDLAGSAQSLQIQRGVGSSTNGPASFGASINLNTLNFSDKRKFYYQYDYSSFNTQRQSLILQSGLLNNKFNLSARLSGITSNGYIQRSWSALFGSQFSASYAINKRTSLALNFMHGKEKTMQAWNGVSQDSLVTNRTFNELGIKSNGDYYNNQSDNYQQRYLQLFINRKSRVANEFNAALYYTRGIGYYEEYKNQQTLLDYGLPTVYDSVTQTTITEADLIRQLWLNNHLLGTFLNYVAKTKHVYTFGFAASTYLGRHYGKVIQAPGLSTTHRWYDLNANKSEWSAFAKAEFNLSKKWLVYVDAQVRNVYYNIEGFRKSPNLKLDLNYLFFNPKLGFNYAFINKPNVSSRVYASFAVANKEPNRDDLESSQQQVAQPENLIDYEAAWELRHKKIAVLLNLFYMKYKNQLINNGKINDVGAYTRVNVEQSFRRGVELELSYKVSPQIRMNANLTLSQNKIRSFSNYIDNYDNSTQEQKTYTNTDIAFSPRSIAMYNITYCPQTPALEQRLQPKFEAILKHVGKQYLDNTQDASRAIKPYTTLDLMSSVQLKDNKNVYQIRFGILNILNKLYEANGYTYSYIYGASLYQFNYFFPQAGRRYSIGASVVF